jgi:hypothetical protein
MQSGEADVAKSTFAVGTDGPIKIDLRAPLTDEQTAVLDQAVGRCSRIFTAWPAGKAGVTIEVLVGALSAGANAEASVTDVWPETGLPERAAIRLRKSAIPVLEQQGRLGAVLAHEILHCLGFGLLWESRNLLHKEEKGPVFTGVAAIAEYKKLLDASGKGGNPTGVPVEDEGIPGQKLFHWRESVFGDELMSSALKAGKPNILSAVTVASLRDLGYAVDLSRSEPFSFGA